MKEMRPTTGKVLLALFNILGNLHGRSFLDLFSGSGKVAAAAWQRGASPVVLVEADRRRCAAIVKSVPRGVKCLCADVRRAVPKLAKNAESFDIIFADPPYNLGWGKELPKIIAENESILARGGLWIFEHSEDEEPELDASRFVREDRKYGGTVLSFFSRREDE